MILYIVFFAQAKSKDFEKLMTEKVVEIEDLPWEKVFNTSLDGPNVNKKLHELFDKSLI